MHLFYDDFFLNIKQLLTTSITGEVNCNLYRFIGLIQVKFFAITGDLSCTMHNEHGI